MHRRERQEVGEGRFLHVFTIFQNELVEEGENLRRNRATGDSIAKIPLLKIDEDFFLKLRISLVHPRCKHAHSFLVDVRELV